VKAVESVSESVLCSENLFADDDYYLNAWTECQFLGIESFNEVKSKLSQVNDLLTYMEFIIRLPKIESLINYNFTDDDGICAVFLYMSLQCFMKHNSEVLVYNDLDIQMCGYLPHSIDVCKRCSDNAKQLESFTQHSKGCPYLNYIFPDIHTSVTVSPKSPKSPYHEESEIVQETLLDNSLVQEMYEKAVCASRTGSYGARCTVHAIPSMASCSKENYYMLAEFSSSNDGHIFTKWLSRVQAIQVSTSQQIPLVISVIYLSCYLHFFFFSVLFTIVLYSCRRQTRFVRSVSLHHSESNHVSGRCMYSYYVAKRKV
jgi:hypothetical protein